MNRLEVDPFEAASHKWVCPREDGFRVFSENKKLVTETRARHEGDHYVQDRLKELGYYD